jgi:RNA polymerase sigma factor (sigma-70 family)
VETPISTEALLRAAAAGDGAAWNQIVARYARLVWSVAGYHRLTGADAEDVSQTTWLRLVENLDSVADPERLGGWLATTARRESVRLLKKKGREVPTFDEASDEPPDTDPDPEESSILREEGRRLKEALQTLNERCRSLLSVMSRAPEDASYDQIAAALGIPTGSIGPTRARCLERLRKLLVQ